MEDQPDDADEMEDAPQVPKPLPSPRPSAGRRRSAGGAMLAAAMIGLQEALEGPREEAPIVEMGNREPDDDQPVALDLDPEDPSNSIAVLRPWLQKPQ